MPKIRTKRRGKRKLVSAYRVGKARRFAENKYLGTGSDLANVGRLLPVKRGELFMPMQMPNSIFTKVVYNCSKLMPTVNVAGTATVNYFRGNGPYDPDTETGGRFPLYWRNYAQLYNKYTCFGSKIKCTFVNNTDATIGAQNIIYGIIPFVVPGTLPTTVSVLNMQPQCKYKFSRINTSAIFPEIKYYMSTKNIFGISKKKVSDDDAFSGFVSTGVPADTWNWAIYVSQPELATGVVTSTIVDVKITYYVRFFDRIEQNVTDTAGIVSAPVYFNFDDGPTGANGP